RRVPGASMRSGCRSERTRFWCSSPRMNSLRGWRPCEPMPRATRRSAPWSSRWISSPSGAAETTPMQPDALLYGSGGMRPVEYRLELCDTSGSHRPIAVITAASPFIPASVGDRFDDEGWTRLDPSDPRGTPQTPRRYTVHSVKHVVTDE